MSATGFSLGHGIGEVLPYIGGAGWIGIAYWIAKLYLTNGELRLKGKAQDQQHKLDTEQHELDVEKHRDSLTIQLLGAAREEIAVLKLAIEEHRVTTSDSEVYVQHFNTALDHIEAMLLADNADERKLAERAARAFLNRMRRMQEARGTITNEIQRLSSEASFHQGNGGDQEAVDE